GERGRDGGTAVGARPGAVPAAQLLPPEFTEKLGAAEVAYRNSVRGGNPFKPYTLATRFEIPRLQASQIVERVNAEIPEDSPADRLAAGGSGPDAGSPPGARAAHNGQAGHG